MTSVVSVPSIHAARPATPHLLLAAMIAAIWGTNFVVIRWGLDYMPPFLFVALRFATAATACFFLPRPKIPLRLIVTAGVVMLGGQFGFMFLSMQQGMPAGLASVLIQAQAPMTIALAALLHRELPTAAQFGALLLAVAGLVIIGFDLDASASVLAFFLMLGGAACWAIGNQMVRAMGSVNAVALIAWMSLFATPPALLLSLLTEPLPAVPDAHGLSVAFFAVFYNAVISTLVGYGAWAWLLARYKAATVAPFSLLVPVIAATMSALLLGETFDAARLVGMALLVLGVAGSVFGARRR
jgi:O-acetylserine/cysteine efflux transporter